MVSYSKCYYDRILDTHCFTFSYTTGLSKISCQISIYYEQYNSCFWMFISENFSVENWRKFRRFLKNTTRVEIIITIRIEVRIRITKALAHKFEQFSTLIDIMISPVRHF